jgi:hypothetical protein
MSSEPLPLLKEALKAENTNIEELKSILSQVSSEQGKRDVCCLIEFYGLCLRA